MRTCMDLNICKVVSLIGFICISTRQSLGTIISKSIAVSYQGNFMMHVRVNDD